MIYVNDYKANTLQYNKGYDLMYPHEMQGIIFFVFRFLIGGVKGA